MAFRVGLLFNSSPGQPLQVAQVASILHEIDERTRSVRGGEDVTLVPFVRAQDEAEFCRALAGDAKLIEAATWDECGVIFRNLQVLATSQHLPREARLDFDRGMSAILSLSHVVVVVCTSSVEFDEVERLIGSLQSIWMLAVVVSLQDNKRHFLEVSTGETRADPTDWFVHAKKRWQTAKPDLHDLPSARTSILGLFFPWAAFAIIRRRFETVKKKPRSLVDRCREGMGISQAAMEKLHADDQRILSQNLQSLCPFFARHDDLGRYHSNVFRTTCLLVPLLIAASTVLAVAAIVDAGEHDLWHVLEGVLLIIAAWFFSRSKISGHHAKWVEHRLTTELMRSSVLCNLLHNSPHLAVPAEETGAWVRQTEVFWTYVRSLPALSFSTSSADLLSARRSAIADYAGYQEQFHTDFAAQHYSAQKWLIKISSRAFLATLCLVVLQLVIAYLPSPKDALAVKLMMTSLIVACGALVLSLLAHQLGFEAIAERSNNAAQHFRNLRVDIDRAAHSANAQQVYAWANTCNQIILAEQHSWYRHIPLIRMHL